MGYALLKLLHLASVIVWVGGMFFTLFCLRPAVATLPPPVRLPFMADVLARFFNVVMWTVLGVLGSGVAMAVRAVQTTRQTGASFNAPADWMVMAGLGLVMVAVFGYVRFALYRRLQRAVAVQDWPAGGAAMTEIRFWVGVNLSLGVLVIVVVMLGSAT